MLLCAIFYLVSHDTATSTPFSLPTPHLPPPPPKECFGKRAILRNLSKIIFEMQAAVQLIMYSTNIHCKDKRKEETLVNKINLHKL